MQTAVGGNLSSTFTTLKQLLEFPLLSRTVKVTTFDPISAQVKLSRLNS